MAIAKTRHNLGEVFIITTPVKLSRKFLGVHFVGGRGVTKFEDKAKRFDEEFDYEVQLPKGFKCWPRAESPAPPEELGEEDTGLEEDEEDEEDD